MIIGLYKSQKEIIECRLLSLNLGEGVSLGSLIVRVVENWEFNSAL